MSTAVKPRKRVAKRPAKKTATKPTAKTRKKSAAKKAPVKKSSARKAPATKTKSRTPAKKTTARKTPAKKTAAKSSGDNFGRELDDHGFVVGTDSSTIAEFLLEGGADRNDINEMVKDAIGEETRNGTWRNVPALVSGVLKRLEDKGYTVESEWRLVAPAPRKKPTAKRKR